jgi:hypothetical protein
MMNGQPGGNLALINNNEEAQPVPGNAVALRSNVPARPRNFLVGDAANEDTFVRAEAANDSRFIGHDKSVENPNFIMTDGVEVTTATPAAKKYNTEGAEDAEVKEKSTETVGAPTDTPDPLMNVRPGADRLEEGLEQGGEAAKALAGVERVKSGMRNWLNKKKEENSATLERIESAAAIAGKGLDWFHKQRMLKVVGGAALLGAAFTAAAPVAITVGVAFKALSATAATKAMYDSMATRLNKQYEEMGDVSQLRKTTMKAGALVVAGAAGFFGSQIVGDMIQESGILDKIKELRIPDLFPAYAGTVPTQYAGTMPALDELGNNQGVAPAAVDNTGWSNNQGGNVATPGQGTTSFGSEFGPGDRPEVTKPNVSQGSWNSASVNSQPGSVAQGVATPGPTAMSTPSGVTSSQPAFGFDAASAAPVGSVEFRDPDNNILGWKLPDESFMKPDGTITQTPTPDKWVDPVTEGERAVFSSNLPETNTQAFTPHKFDLGVEESHIKPPEVKVDVAPVLPTDDVWRAGEGVLVDSNGQSVQSGFSSAPTEAPVAPQASGVPTKPVELGTITPAELKPLDVGSNGPAATTMASSPEVVNVAGTPAVADTPLSEAERLHLEEMSRPNPDAVVAPEPVQAVTAAPAQAQPFKMNFAPDPTSPMTVQDMQQATKFNNLMLSKSFDQDLMAAAKAVDGDKSLFGSFGDKGALLVRNNFVDVIKNNPQLTIEGLLNADPASLSTKEAGMLKEARGVLRRMITEEYLSNPANGQVKIIDALEKANKVPFFPKGRWSELED